MVPHGSRACDRTCCLGLLPRPNIDLQCILGSLDDTTTRLSAIMTQNRDFIHLLDMLTQNIGYTDDNSSTNCG